MASTVCQKPAVDYFSLSRQQTESTSPFNWDSEPALVNNSDSCDSILPSPTASNPIFSKPSYILPKEDSFQAANDRKSSTGQAFDFGTFEDWMRWDDPSDAALSPTSDFFPELKIEPISPVMGGLELSRNLSSINPNSIDETAVFGDDNLIENGEPLFQNSQNNLMSSPIIDIPPRENLYSTPLSWARPQMNNVNPSLRRAQTIPQPQQQLQQQQNFYNRTLTPQEELQLRAIAMPQTQAQSTQFPASPSSSVTSPSHSPVARSTRPQNSLKRKSSHSCSESNSDEDEVPAHPSLRHPPIKKTAHNMIEKRYRTNLNDKIALLRDSVPSLRIMSRKCSRGEGHEDRDGDEEMEEDLQGLTPAHKLNKATVLSKATEYINHLEKRNKHLQKENAALKSRIEAFEMLLMSQQTQSSNPAQQKQQRARYS